MILGFNIGFLEITGVDILDILLVAVLLYQVYKLMRGSVAFRIFSGFLILYLIYLVVSAARMELLSSILGQFMGVGVLAVIVLFQQEIRKFLLIVGRTGFLSEGGIMDNIKSMWKPNSKYQKSEITPIIDACKTLGGSNTGALIVFSKNSELKFYSETGDLMQAMVSKRLLLSIFNKLSPLHDGAVIIYHNRIVAARCILPVTERDVDAHYGLRHRAAIGMSESTDTLVLVVSEETGQMSVMKNGQAFNNLSAQEVRKMINEYLYEDARQKSPSGKSPLEQAKEESKPTEKEKDELVEVK